jgi:protein-disulfide isomerase
MNYKSLICALFFILFSGAYADTHPQFPAKGGTNPEVTIISFSDFQCPYCSKSDATMNQLLSSYGNKVQLVFRNMPLPLHKEAKSAAVAGYCASQQGKFWEMHDLLLKNSNQLGADLYPSLASEIGLDTSKFQTCLTSEASANAINTDLADASALQIQAVPSFILVSKNRSVKVTGSLPISEFQTRIDDLITSP